MPGCLRHFGVQLYIASQHCPSVSVCLTAQDVVIWDGNQDEFNYYSSGSDDCHSLRVLLMIILVLLRNKYLEKRHDIPLQIVR